MEGTMRTRIVWVTLGLLLTLGVACIIAGWWNRKRPPIEYGGLTVTQWDAEICNWEVAVTMISSKGGRHMYWVRKESEPPEGGWSDDEMPLLRGDPEAIPVLVVLLRSPNHHARLIAVQGLRRCQKQARSAIPALLKALDDPDDNVRGYAAETLFWLDREVAKEAGVECSPLGIYPPDRPKPSAGWTEKIVGLVRWKE
jgi:hypothetical protein